MRRTRHSMQSILLCLCLCLPALSAARVPSPDAALQQEVLVLLLDGLQQAGPVYSDSILERLSPDAPEGRTALRRSLTLMLDAVDGHRQQKTDTWQAWLQLRGVLSEREAARLLGQLVKASRRIIESDANYVLGTSMAWAARKARVPLEQARPFALALLQGGIARETAGGPEPAGLLVTGRTNAYEFGMEPLYLFFGTRDDKFILEEVRDIQRFVVPRLVKVLPEAGAIRYAVRKRDRTALLIPDYLLLVEVDELSFTGTNFDLRPCMETTLKLTSGNASDRQWTQSFRFCTDEQGSKNTHSLHGFYDEMAREIGRRLVEYLVGE